MRRDPQDVTRAVRRVQFESPAHLAELVALSGASPTTMRRWIIQGRLGVHLDGFRHREGYWCSSPAAVVRFVAEAARAEQWREEKAARPAG